VRAAVVQHPAAHRQGHRLVADGGVVGVHRGTVRGDGLRPHLPPTPTVNLAGHRRRSAQPAPALGHAAAARTAHGARRIMAGTWGTRAPTRTEPWTLNGAWAKLAAFGVPTECQAGPQPTPARASEPMRRGGARTVYWVAVPRGPHPPRPNSRAGRRGGARTPSLVARASRPV
jgi:hypothetical protein